MQPRGAVLPTDLRLESEPDPRARLQTSHSLDLTFSKRIDRVIFLSLRLIAKMPARLTASQMARFGRRGHAAAPPLANAEDSVISVRCWNRAVEYPDLV